MGKQFTKGLIYWFWFSFIAYFTYVLCSRLRYHIMALVVKLPFSKILQNHVSRRCFCESFVRDVGECAWAEVCWVIVRGECMLVWRVVVLSRHVQDQFHQKYFTFLFFIFVMLLIYFFCFMHFLNQRERESVRGSQCVRERLCRVMSVACLLPIVLHTKLPIELFSYLFFLFFITHLFLTFSCFIFFYISNIFFLSHTLKIDAYTLHIVKPTRTVL